MPIEPCEWEKWRQQVRQDALAAWESYQATGLHVTAEEADTWLVRLEDGEDREPPATHR
jgi:predicted transcriptional regulator